MVLVIFSELDPIETVVRLLKRVTYVVLPISILWMRVLIRQLIPNKTVFYVSIMGPLPCIRRGRDIINNGTTPKPGYKPYAYPHPLVSGVSVASRKTAKDREQTVDTSSSSK